MDRGNEREISVGEILVFVRYHNEIVNIAGLGGCMILGALYSVAA